MHDTTQIQQVKQQADCLLLLSFTPLGLIGVPRLMAGKSMRSWKFAGLLYVIGFSLVMNAAQLSNADPTIVEILNVSGIFSLGWAVLLHIYMVIKDMAMFWRISEDKQRLIESQLGTQRLTHTTP